MAMMKKQPPRKSSSNAGRSGGAAQSVRYTSGLRNANNMARVVKAKKAAATKGQSGGSAQAFRDSNSMEKANRIARTSVSAAKTYREALAGAGPNRKTGATKAAAKAKRK